VLWCLGRSLWTISALIAPVLPAAAAHLRGWLGVTGAPVWPVIEDDRVLPGAPALELVPPTGALFPRLDDAAQTAVLAAVVPGDVQATTSSTPMSKLTEGSRSPSNASTAASTITFEEFGKLDLRAGKVVAAAAVPKAKKLLHLSVDLGEATPRSVVAGIAERYKPEELVGKTVIVVANLAPATIRGIQSEGMILAAAGDSILGVSAIDSDVPPGTRVK
jgi:methionyl-tRNA synthetase